MGSETPCEDIGGVVFYLCAGDTLLLHCMKGIGVVERVVESKTNM